MVTQTMVWVVDEYSLAMGHILLYLALVGSCGLVCEAETKQRSSEEIDRSTHAKLDH